jgi:hypothetical protein
MDNRVWRSPRMASKPTEDFAMGTNHARDPRREGLYPSNSWSGCLVGLVSFSDPQPAPLVKWPDQP